MIKKMLFSLLLLIVLFLTTSQFSYADYDSFTVNVPSAQGGYVAVIIKKSGSGYVGPQGEYYSDFPTVYTLQSTYGVPDYVQSEKMLEQQADQANQANMQREIGQQKWADEQMQESIRQQNARVLAQQQAQERAEQQVQQSAQQQAQQQAQEQQRAQLQEEQQERDQKEQQSRAERAALIHEIVVDGLVFVLCLGGVIGVVYYWSNITKLAMKIGDLKTRRLPKISSGAFGLIILMFLLPWNSISCSNQQIISFTGLDLVIGKDLPPQGLSDQVQRIQDSKAVMILVIGFVGLIAGLLMFKEKLINVVQAVCGWTAGVLLCLLKSKWEHDVYVQSGGMVVIDYHLAFWLVMVLSFAIGIGNVLSLVGVLKQIDFNWMKNTVTEED